RETTITLYTDVEAVGLEDTTIMRIIIVDRDGNVYWQGEGDYTEEKFEALARVINTLIADEHAGS
ncbi:MAG: hypothetical protein AAF125_19915, partial [Chloroflexota bacterium]